MRVEVTDFVLWKSGDKLSGYAKYHGLKKYPCVVKSGAVLLKVGGKWRWFGKYYELEKPESVRARKEYTCIGIIWTPGYTYYVLKDGNRFLAI